MTSGPLRVALFSDSFHEVSGVALTARRLESFARERNYPFFSVHAGPRTASWTEGSVTRFEIKRTPLALRVEEDLYVDPLLLRLRPPARQALLEFEPDIVHITGPNDVGIMGWLIARRIGVPLTASWHTNVHQFGAWRLRKTLSFLPESWNRGVGDATERLLLRMFTQLYYAAQHCFAPNPELIAMLRERTGKPVDLMRRGVDVELYRPERRRREDDVFEIGYVGRISAEKNVRFLKTLEDGLLRRGKTRFRIVVVGHGGEREWLQASLRTGVFPGLLRGEELARAYAGFDLFAFPSHTDTYGNVVNEAMACGTPCLVTSGGGPKYLIRDGETGVAARDDEHFIDAAAALMDDRERLARMSAAARRHALANSWERVFEELYERYAEISPRFSTAAVA